MKKQYVVRMINGYYQAENKKDAIEFLNENDTACDVIYTASSEGNYYHNRVNVIASK